MKATVTVTLKNGVLDPQGAAVGSSLTSLGFENIENVRIGKVIHLTFSDRINEAEIEDMCRKLLVNTVIEDYKIEITS